MKAIVVLDEWCTGDIDSLFTYFACSGLLKFDMKMFVNIVRLENGQLITQGVRQGHSCTLDTVLIRLDTLIYMKHNIYFFRTSF